MKWDSSYEGREGSRGPYETWKSRHFEGGRCRRHPEYEGMDLPPDPTCDGCAVIYRLHPAGEEAR